MDPRDDGAGSPPVLDPERLDHHTGGDTGLQRQLLEMFVPNALGYLATMQAAGDRDAWYVAAHSLKGAALSVGALELGELARRAEAMWQAGAGARAAHCDAMGVALGQLEQRISALLAGRGG